MKKKDKEVVKNAVLHSTLKQVKFTLEKHKLVLDKSFFDYELLKTALGRHHVTIVNLLLRKDCRVRNPTNIEEEETALHLAVKLNNAEIIKKMLNRGASIYDKNHKGEVPIYTAFKGKHYNAVDAILTYCCNLKNHDPEDKAHIIHFHIACIRNNLYLARLYITSGFDINNPLSLYHGDCVPHTMQSYKPCNCNSCEEIPVYPGTTPLSFAVMEDFTQLVQLLLENGADSNKADEEGNTPLHQACQKLTLERKPIFKMLLEYKANLEAVNKNGFTPLHIAFYYVNSVQKSIFDMILEKESWGPTNFTNDQGLSYFHIACTTNNVNQVEKFLNSAVNIDSPVTSGMYSGYTALHFAVLHNQKEVVELLLKRNAQVNVKATEKEITPLHLACEFNYLKFYEISYEYHWVNIDPTTEDWTSNCQNQVNIIKLLLLHNADIEAKDWLGKTPLFHVGIFDIDYDQLEWLISFRHILVRKLSIRLVEIIGLLLNYNAIFNILTNNQSSILHNLSENNFLKIPEELVKFFVNVGLDVNAVNDAGLTPLHVAVNFDNGVMVYNLIKNKADINAKNKSKDFIIPLHIIIKKSLKLSPTNEGDVLCLLLKYGSNINIVYNRGRTILHDMVDFKRANIVKKLLHYGADINMEDSKGHSPIYYFIEEDSDFELVDWFINSSKDTFVVFYSHIKKLLALGLYVSQQVKGLSALIYQNYKDSISTQRSHFNHIFNNCLEEKKKMELIKIDKDTSLYGILQKSSHELLKYIKNSNLVKIINESIDHDFPLCGHLLEVQYRRGLVRRDILQSAQASLTVIIGFSIPVLCMDLIMHYLSNEELDYVITAATMADSSINQS